MRYVILFDENNKQTGSIHYTGKKINPDEEVKKIDHPNWKRFSEEMIKDLTGEEDWEEKALYIDLDDNNEPFFNVERYNKQND